MNPAQLVRNARLVINKVTQHCNLSCTYCSAMAVRPDGSIDHISDEVFDRAVALFVGETHQPMIEWLFHGGEPLLLPASWYRRAFDRIEQVARRNPRLRRLQFALQTNAVALKEEHLELFVERRCTVSSSLDGAPEVNDLHRGKGKTALKNIARLAEAGIGGGVITVLTPLNVDRVEELLDYFAAHGVNGVKLNNMVCVGRGEEQSGISAEQFARAQFRYVERVARLGRVDLLSRELQSVVEEFVAGPDRVVDRQTCYSYECAAGRYFFGVESTGDVFPCGRGADTKAFRLFNVMEREVEAAGPKAALHTLHHKDPWYVRCFGCSAKRICTFGCPAFEYENLPERELQCASTKALYRLLEENPAVAQAAALAFRAAAPASPLPLGISVEQKAPELATDSPKTLSQTQPTP
ncbi:MAG: radical SAM protein [Deltaproteobacteria bacterium]|nr:radical SAM protein [Deltaproteobacteria bacterium]